MRSAGLTDTGRKRERNEDSILLNDAVMLYIVTDGMGGHELGDVASRMAVDGINEYVEDSMTRSDAANTVDEDRLRGILSEVVSRVNSGIYRYSQDRAAGVVMGTTVSAVLLKGRKLYTVHVGDSRIYRLRNDTLEQLTKDHSRVQELVDRGLMYEEVMEQHALSHILTRALGPYETVRPDIGTFDIEPGDSFLLCTDGLFRTLDITRMKDILTSGRTAEEKCRALVDGALAGGAPDNVSVIVLEP